MLRFLLRFAPLLGILCVREKSVQHNANYVVFLRLNHQAKSFHFSAVLRAGAHDIDPRSINAAVSQNIRQLGNILFQPVKGPSKQLSQIMRKDLGRVHARTPAQPLHFSPNIAAVHGSAVS